MHCGYIGEKRWLSKKWKRFLLQNCIIDNACLQWVQWRGRGGHRTQPWHCSRSGHYLNFFCFLFCKKIIDLPWGQINDPSLGKHYSLLFLLAIPSSPSWTLEGLFELTRRPSRALDSPRALLPELQRYKDTVRCGALGAEVPEHRQQLLDCAFVENALL